MLVLTRKTGEEIVIDGGIRIRIVETKKNSVRIGIVAPAHVRVDRQEIVARRSEFQPRLPRRVNHTILN